VRSIFDKKELSVRSVLQEKPLSDEIDGDGHK